MTSWAKAAAENFGASGLREHDERYRQAEEALDVVQSLWDSLEDDAVVIDREHGIYNDVTKIHRTDHRGTYFTVRGPLGSARSPQGQPVIFQAGSSTAGVDFAGRRADVVFVGKSQLGQAREFRSQLAETAHDAGRPNAPLVTAMLAFITRRLTPGPLDH